MRGARSLLLALAVVLAVAACGGSGSASSPLTTALSYFPKDSPFVMSVVTDPNSSAVKSAQSTVGRVPFANFGEAALISRLQQLGINYDADIRPLFGNPLIVGLDTTSTSGARNNVLFAWVTKDSGTLSNLINKLHLPSAGSHGGAKLYEAPPVSIAVDGATLLVGTSQASVTAALDRHSGSHGMSSSDFNSQLGDLPKDALISAVGNLSGPLSSPSAAKGRSVPWVAALSGYGFSAKATSGGLTFQYTLNTPGGSLSSTELPIAPGSSPPGLVGSFPVQIGLREPAQTINFLLDVVRRTQPAKYARDQAHIAAVEKRTGVNFQHDVIGQMGSNAAVETTGHTTLVRIDVVDPSAAARTLRKLGSSAPDILGTHPGSHVTPGPAGFATVHQANGKTVLFGLVGSEFVAGNAGPAQLRAFASAPATAAPGAQGAAAFRIGLPQLLRLTLHSAPSQTVQQVLSVLGDVTGWVSSSTSALTGSATLGFK